MRDSRLYGVELDSITGRIAKKLYPQADITVAGFETTDRRDFYDLAVGNVPFGNYKVNDKAYNKLGFSISALKNIRKYIDMVLNKQQLSAPGGKMPEKESVLKKLEEAKTAKSQRKAEQKNHTQEL